MAEQDQANFTPNDFIVSKLRFYSIGIVAVNKALGSKEIEVTPVEELPMLDGELTDKKTDYSGKATDASGKAYASTVDTQVTLKAKWMRFANSYYLTAPDVRRGESVMIYQFGDADAYYWMTLKDDSHLRRLETVIWAISATRDEATKALTAENSYYFEVSSHNKLIHLHTSTADGEPFAYDLQINTKTGQVVITDDVGNYISLDSAERRLELHNGDDSHFDLNKGDLTVTTKDSVTYHTKNFTVNSSTASINSSGAMSMSAGTSVNMSGGGAVSIAGSTVDIT